MQTYIVQPGDTLYGISKQYGISVENIKQLNNLTSNNLAIGQKLLIPTNINASLTYTVKKGDSLYSIARAYNTTVADLKRINNLKSDSLSIGQQLIIPSKSMDNTSYINYTVKRGDSLYSIAKSYNTTVNELVNFNNLTSSLLSIGQVLKIPSNVTIPPNNDNNTIPAFYTVKYGDSLYSIAREFNTTVNDLINLNKLTTTALKVGQVLRIREVPNSNYGKECFGSSYVTPKYETYTVKKGDSLYTIATRFNTSVDNLKRLNNLTSNNLSIGQVLKIREV